MNSSFSPISSVTQRSIADRVSIASFTNSEGTISGMFRCMISCHSLLVTQVSSNISKNVDNPSAKTGVGAQPQGQTSSGLSSRLGYNVGDMVSHVKFGKGKVLSIDAATRDYMVTVEFQEYGIKKMLAGFARLKKQ